MRDSIGIGLMGLGVIGGQVARVLRDRVDLLAEQAGYPLVLRKVKVMPADMTRPLAVELGDKVTTDVDTFFNEPGIDIIIEVIGGEHPAFEYQQRALTTGRHVVTANKELISKHGIELMSLAQQHQVGLRFEASVGGGIPLISPFQNDLVANKINRIYAIINGTTNYILTRMAQEGVDFASALKKAQELGYAETNPRDDVEGIDASYKLAILSTLGFHTQVKPENIYREGISRLTSLDFRYAKELGYAIKLLAIGKQDDSNIEVRVHPVFIPDDSLLAEVDGVFNAILVEGDLVGRILFYGQGAGPLPTSSAVTSDVIAAAKDIIRGGGSSVRWKAEPGKHIKPMSDIETRYYFRLNVADRAGVLAQISTVLGDLKISIASVIQKESDLTAKTAQLIIMTHPASEKAVQQAIGELAKLQVVKEVANVIRVEDY